MTRVSRQRSERTVLSKVGAVAVIAALSLAPLSGGEGFAFAAGEPACGPLVGGVHEISRDTQLREVGSGGTAVGADCRLDASYLLKEHILLDSDWTAIGSSAEPFTGTFDGGQKTITGLTMPTGATDAQGMFSATQGATITDLELADVTIIGSNNVGALVGFAQSGTTITNVSAEGDVGGGERIGGLVGLGVAITVSASEADVRVIGDSPVGGLIGTFDGGAIDDSLAKGQVQVSFGPGSAGGFVGTVISGAITRSHAEGQVSGGSPAGGFVGQLGGAGEIRESSAAGRVLAGSNGAGGFVGKNDGNIQSSVATGVVNGVGQVGGFAGENSGTITSSQASGDLTGTGSSVGGFVGENSGTITSSQASGDVAGQTFQVGGFAGLNKKSGGPGVISQSSSSDQDVTGSHSVGGFAGAQQDGATINASFTSSRAEGSSATNTRVGGFLGQNLNDSIVTDSYSTGSAKGTDVTGGFVGSNADTAQILRSYSTATVVGASLFGGFVGENGATASISDSFWDLDLSVTPARDGVDDGATGKTSSDMNSLSTFSNVSTVGLDEAWPIVDGWVEYAPNADPARVWGICSGVNDGYPFLLWQFDSGPCVVSAGGVTGSSSSPEKRSSDAGIHLDFQASVGGVVAGSSVVIGGQGLSGRSQYSLVVRSTPQTLASGTASALGNFSGRASLPALSSGSHTLTLTATALDGSALILVQSFTVAANGTISAIGSPTGSQSGGLAATGVEGVALGAGLAAVMVLAGLFLVGVSRRKTPLIRF